MSPHLSDELLSAHHDGALDAAEVGSVASHLAGCSDCGRRLALLQATSRAVAGLPGEVPGPIDFSFLATPRDHVVSLPARTRWQSPRWVAPLLAAAAVLLVAGGVGSLALRPPGSTSGASTALGRPQLADGGAVPGGGGATGGPGSVPAPGSVTGRADSGPGLLLPQDSRAALPGASSSRTFAAAGGATLSVNASPAAAQRGQATQYGMALRAGSSAVEVRELRVTLRRGRDTVGVLGAGPQTVPVGNAATLFGTWDAGQGAVPGDYLVEARAVLADGSELLVEVTIRRT
ncbi:MAG: hypothetical protein NVSMB17_02150 [Candidatus Dormibacteria bacterium]